MENLPPEVCFIILSYLPLNDLVEASSVCKLFFNLSRKNSFFVEKLLHSRLLFNNSCVIFDCYENAFLSFYSQLCFSLEKYIKEEDYFLEAKKIIMKKLMLSKLLLRVSNHMFLCKRSQHCIDICIICTKSYIFNKKISNHINKKLYICILHNFILLLEKELLLVKKFTCLHIQMFLLIKITHLEDLQIFKVCITRV